MFVVPGEDSARAYPVGRRGEARLRTADNFPVRWGGVNSPSPSEELTPVQQVKVGLLCYKRSAVQSGENLNLKQVNRRARVNPDSAFAFPDTPDSCTAFPFSLPALPACDRMGSPISKFRYSPDGCRLGKWQWSGWVST
jgi:hypothetical protein